MNYKYGDFNQNQISVYKNIMRKKIFFLLLCVDDNTKEEYADIDVNQVFENTLNILGGYNSLINYPPEMVTIMSLLEAAHLKYNSSDFNFKTYRKLILDAGNEVLKIKEVD